MMLMNGATLPFMVHKDDRIEHHFAEYDDDAFTNSDLEPSFRIEYNDGVYRLSLKRWSGHPHFATAYYDEKEELLLASDRRITRLNSSHYCAARMRTPASKKKLICSLL